MSTRSARDRPCIVGIGQTEFTRRGGIVDRSELRLAAEAAIAAAADAGLPCREIDGFAAAFRSPMREVCCLCWKCSPGWPRG
jgi:acetyl-CoA acetyltransferase